MATAIYFGANVFIRILEDRGIEKGNNPSHIEAAILSYRNSIVERIIEENIFTYLNTGLLASSRNNNIKGSQLVLSKGADINVKYINYQNIIILLLINII